MFVNQMGSQRNAKSERDQHRGQRDSNDEAHLGIAAGAVQFEPDEKHEQKDTQVCEGNQGGPGVRREHDVRHPSGQHSWSDNDPGDDLADHPRLAHPIRDSSASDSEKQDQRKIEQQSRTRGQNAPWLFR